jgi:rare lipoprotein A (peptidoglycan hydrolase)
VPVVDRGPFVKGMTWDITEAAAQQLGFTETARIGALVQP